MLSAIEILIERTKTHPEEFAKGGKWGDLIKEFGSCISAEETKALDAAVLDAVRVMFNEAVMKRLVGTDAMSDIDEAMAAKMAQKPSKILTTKQMSQEALKIIEGEFDKEYSRFTKEYDINTDSYYLKEKK